MTNTPSREQIQNEFDKAEDLLSAEVGNSEDQRYIKDVRDTLGWVLGHYDRPLQDY